MSYDGGLSIKIINSELLKISDEHLKKGTFDGSEAIQDFIGTKHHGKTFAIDYEYMDCAYVNFVPQNLKQVLNGVIELFDEYADDLNIADYRLFKSELKDSAAIINDSYEYVNWLYVDEHGEEHIFTYGDGEYDEE